MPSKRWNLDYWQLCNQTSPPLEAAETFYGETLGFGLTVRMNSAAFFAAGDYHHHIGTNTWSHRSGPVGDRGPSWFEVILPDTSALNALRDRFASSQIPVTEADGGIIVSDSDGSRFGSERARTARCRSTDCS
ncbi:MAG: catechol 2,3-dioxygenase [Natronomonas sp.]|jgi:catechol 2,3-dioxygenase|uniref:VOC family protein n=1 Tax=Natronomonas sp. TaxID=2184060 RepID=UPI00398A06EB